MLNDVNDTEPGGSAPHASRAARGAGPAPDEPLDPQIERIRRKLSRLILVGIGTLLVGVLAVFGAVLYRSAGSGSTPVARGDLRVPLIPGAELLDASLAENGLLLRIAMPDGSTQLVVLDPVTGEPRLRVSVGRD